MAILFFYINPDKGDKVDIKLTKHKGEKETDLSYQWARSALEQAIQLNFNSIKINPYTEDQGAKIHFLTKDILENNKLNIYGYPYLLEDDDLEIEDDDDCVFKEERDFIDLDIETESQNMIYDNPEYVRISLDLHDACSVIGGLTVPTAKVATALYSKLKHEASKPR